MTWYQKKAQSINILNSYKNEVTKESYDRILYVIGTQAIEDMFMSKKSIKNLIRIERGKISTEDLLKEYKKEWGII